MACPDKKACSARNLLLRLPLSEQFTISAAALRHRRRRQSEEPAMGLFSKDIKTMNDLFVHQLQDIYYAEKQLVKTLPTMAEKETAPQQQKRILTHLDETRQHDARLEEVFKMHGAEIKAVNCPAIDCIIEEAEDTAGEVEDKHV